jgi:hypothetical protein
MVTCHVNDGVLSAIARIRVLRSILPDQMRSPRALELALGILLAGTLWLTPLAASGQQRPSYCDQTAAPLLQNLQTPYAVRTGPGGDQYCEGLLVRPIALAPPTVISVKQAQQVQTFASRTMASITWCDDPVSAVHIRLRSTKVPYFGLDAFQAKSFAWPTDIIAAWQPSWDNIAAVGTRRIKVSGREYDASIPLRVGTGYANTYIFLIRARSIPSIKKAVVRPVGSDGSPRIIDAVLIPGPASDVWKANISFQGISDGLYGITFSESPEDAGVTTTPINILHKSCAVRG